MLLSTPPNSGAQFYVYLVPSLYSQIARDPGISAILNNKGGLLGICENPRISLIFGGGVLLGVQDQHAILASALISEGGLLGNIYPKQNIRDLFRRAKRAEKYYQ